ncbi:MAG: hypothetical protein JSS66_04625 [Armatimonadetes bacterium]|nr:hypothetical protein [Armatimonadota bacterium]
MSSTPNPQSQDTIENDNAAAVNEPSPEELAQYSATELAQFIHESLIYSEAFTVSLQSMGDTITETGMFAMIVLDKLRTCAYGTLLWLNQKTTESLATLVEGKDDEL